MAHDRLSPSGRCNDPREDSRFADVFQRYLEELKGNGFVDPDEILVAHPDLGPAVLEDLETYIQLRSPDESVPQNQPLGTLGDYTLRRQIGRGGMGVVYDAWQNSMKRQVALKVLPAGIAVDRRACARFLREAQTAGQLNHENVVRVYSTGIEEGTPWYSMEFVEGETVAQILAKIKDAEPETETPFGPKDQVDYFAKLARAFADVADGLQHAHSKGVIHRDIKPSNLILDADGRLRILDFGLARLEGQESLTLSGDFVGTPQYMSPEQARRRKIPIDHRTDVYSLGATMYEAFCGRPPFRGKDHNDTLSQIVERDPVEPRKVNPRVPKDLETIVLKCLRKDAGDRYGTAEALAQDLRRFVHGEVIEARSQSTLEKTARRMWLYRRVLVPAVILLAIGVVGFATSTVLLDELRHQAILERDRARQNLYLADMRSAQGVWEAGNVGRCVSLLERWLPEADEADLRGWEWYHLWSIRDQSLQTLAGHSDVVRSVHFSPDGRFIASGSADATVRIWDSITGEVLQTVLHGNAVTSVAWHPVRPGVLAVGEDDGRVIVWDVTKGHREFDRLLADRSARVAWNPHDHRLAAAGNDRVTVWCVETEAELWSHPVPGINGISWSPSGRRLAIASAGFRGQQRSLAWGVVAVWDTASWSRLAILEERHHVRSIAWSPDETRLSSSIQRPLISIWNTATWERAEVLPRGRLSPGHQGAILSAAWSPEGDRLVSGGQDGKLLIWNLSEEEEPSEPMVMRGHAGRVVCVDWWPDGRFLVSGSSDGTLRIWRSSGASITPMFPSALIGVAWSPDGTTFASGGEKAGNVALWDASTGENVETIWCGEDAALVCVAFSPDGRLLATTWADRFLRIWDVGTGELHLRRELPAQAPQVRSVAWSPTSRWLATSVDRSAMIWDVDSGKLVHTLDFDEPVGSIAWSPDGSRLAVACSTRSLSILDARTFRVVFRIELARRSNGFNGQDSFAWSPDGGQLAAGSPTGDLFVLDTRTGEELARIQAHTGNLKTVAWSPDCRRLATGSVDQTIKIWDAESGEALLTLPAYDEPVNSLAWSPDGRRLASSSVSSVKIWDAPGFSAEPRKRETGDR